MLILWYFEYTTVAKISENETAFKIAALGLQGLCDNGSSIIILSEISCVYVKKKMQLDAFN